MAMKLGNWIRERGVGLAALVVLAAAPLLQAVEIREARTRYMETAQFQRVAEFFTGREHPGNRAILRSDPASRDGAYFILRLDQASANLPAGTRIELSVIASDDKDPKTHSFDPTTAERSSKNVYLGLTGADWPSPEVEPMAWRVLILGADGATLAEWKSFLWSMP